MIYMMADEKRMGTNFKVGFTRNIDKRMVYYATHNPNAHLISTVVTYKKTKMELEGKIHEEIKKMGFDFLIADNGIETEWFFVPADRENEFLKKGLAMFKACKNRKIYK